MKTSLLLAFVFCAALAAGHAEPLARLNRVALVIGNSAYTEIGALANPVNDARAIGTTLEGEGFAVTRLENASLRQMMSSLEEFGKKIQGNSIGLFYFSGHGIQVSGANYLVPIGAHIASESDVRYESVDAGRVLGKMADAGNPLNIVILDACRNNPFARSFRSATRGLAMMDAPGGVLIAYATAPGETAEDNPDGQNGLYTKYLLKHMVRPGLKVEEVLKAVRADVSRESKASGHPQIPWESSSLIGDFYFAEPSAAVARVETPVPTPEPTPAVTPSPVPPVSSPAPSVSQVRTRAPLVSDLGVCAVVDMAMLLRECKIPTTGLQDKDTGWGSPPANRVRKRILAAVETVARERHIDFVYERQWAYHPRYFTNITEEVLAELRK